MPLGAIVFEWSAKGQGGKNRKCKEQHDLGVDVQVPVAQKGTSDTRKKGGKEALEVPSLWGPPYGERGRKGEES